MRARRARSEKCKAVADKRSGVIHVDATGVGGPLAWGGASDEAVNAFSNEAACWGVSWYASGSSCLSNYFRATAVCCPP